MEEQKELTAQEVLKLARKERIKDVIDTKAERSIEVLHEVMDSEDSPPIVRVTAAKDILDRAGFKPVEKQVIAHILPKPILDLPIEVIERETK
jgi:hypothetical protein